MITTFSIEARNVGARTLVCKKDVAERSPSIQYSVFSIQYSVKIRNSTPKTSTDSRQLNTGCTLNTSHFDPFLILPTLQKKNPKNTAPALFTPAV